MELSTCKYCGSTTLVEWPEKQIYTCPCCGSFYNYQSEFQNEQIEDIQFNFDQAVLMNCLLHMTSFDTKKKIGYFSDLKYASLAFGFEIIMDEELCTASGLADFYKYDNIPIDSSDIRMTLYKLSSCGLVDNKNGKYAWSKLHNQIFSSTSKIKLAQFPEIESLIQEYKDEITTSNSIGTSAALNSESLLEYLKQISSLENCIYALSERYNYLRIAYELTSVDAATSFILQRMKINRKLSDASEKKPSKPNIFKPSTPIHKTPGLFNKKKIEAENQEADRKYQNELAAYNKEMESYESDLSKYNNQISSINEQLNKLPEINQSTLESAMLSEQKPILEELEVLKSEIKKAVITLSSLYEKNIIYGKYRDIVAVSSFCDYFMAGRCSELAGKDGAYNLYEQESLSHTIINKLDDILSSLNTIKNNQYYLYQQLLNTNEQLTEINNQLVIEGIIDLAQLITLDSINSNSKAIAKNTAVTAFYAKRSAELESAIAFLTAMN